MREPPASNLVSDLSYGRITSSLPVNGHYQGANILVAGMRASTTYHMLPSVNCPNGTLTSQDLTFQTGALPSIPLPQMTVTRPNPSTSSPENPGIELIDIVAPGENKLQAYFTDRDANPIWYYDVGSNGDYPFAVKLLPNGHVILTIDSSSGGLNFAGSGFGGEHYCEMNIAALDQKTQAAGFDFTPTFYHHDVLPLDNGHLIVLTNTTKDFTDLPGYPARPTFWGMP